MGPESNLDIPGRALMYQACKLLGPGLFDCTRHTPPIAHLRLQILDRGAVVYCLYGDTRYPLVEQLIMGHSGTGRCCARHV